MKTVLDVIQQMAHLDIFFKTLIISGLVMQLKSNGPWTVLAPTDQALLSLPPKCLRALLKNKTKLALVLSYHIMPGRWPLTDIIHKKSAITQLGLPLVVKIGEDIEIKLNDAEIIKADIEAGNGIIHVIDSLLIPELGQNRQSGFRTALI